MAATETEIVIPARTKSLPESSTAPAVRAAGEDWLCAWCLNRVAQEQDRFVYKGKDEFTFANPEGIRFAIITFSQTRGCREAGLPTLEYTWFSGHAWSYCLCAGCGQHLGWYYAGQHHFAGLIRDRMVRGCVRN